MLEGNIGVSLKFPVSSNSSFYFFSYSYFSCVKYNSPHSGGQSPFRWVIYLEVIKLSSLQVIKLSSLQVIKLSSYQVFKLSSFQYLVIIGILISGIINIIIIGIINIIIIAIINIIIIRTSISISSLLSENCYCCYLPINPEYQDMWDLVVSLYSSCYYCICYHIVIVIVVVFVIIVFIAIIVV